jgi:hypothetical protein
MKVRQLVGLLVAVFGCVVASSSCAPSAVAPGGEAKVHLSADLSGTVVATLVAQVTAADIPSGLVFNIPIINSAASGTITVPAGSGRNIHLRAYDAAGVQTHDGQVTVGIVAGTNPTIAVVLTPLNGDLPIEATLGSLSVTVSPSASNLLLGLTLDLTASIKDSNGNPVAGTVAWATRDPGIAVVDGTGLVTATGVGVTTISATFGGTAGVATITVTQ